MKKDLLLLMLALSVISAAQNNNTPLNYNLHDRKTREYLQIQFQNTQFPEIILPSDSDNRFTNFKNITNDLKDDALRARLRYR
ncbi:hypothetical protein [Chryseobacterium sp. ISL-6]|uniref:hypothetical protein n=1 Tax=Chryseobacterium sp. ISL-6 TaxID=2819143 RepID=UPI001BE8C6BC|nr:hypothetical protein [Chryseobacterium sp. ISL-6]MBT2623533.1 hypothetical protein [Chryseobacterium sp. ISL-6]